MKAVLLYCLALIALVVVIFRKDHVQAEPSPVSPWWDVRVTVKGLGKIKAEGVLTELLNHAGNFVSDPIGQIAPEGMLK